MIALAQKPAQTQRKNRASGLNGRLGDGGNPVPHATYVVRFLISMCGKKTGEHEENGQGRRGRKPGEGAARHCAQAGNVYRILGGSFWGRDAMRAAHSSKAIHFRLASRVLADMLCKRVLWRCCRGQ